MKRVNTLLLGLCLITPVTTMAAAPVPTADADAPDLELLEFLGEWSGEGEAWLQQMDKSKDEKPAVAPKKSEVKNDE